MLIYLFAFQEEYKRQNPRPEGYEGYRLAPKSNALFEKFYQVLNPVVLKHPYLIQSNLSRFGYHINPIKYLGVFQFTKGGQYLDGWINDFGFYVLFNSTCISVISG